MFSTHYVKVGRCIFAHGPGPRLLDRAADGEAPLPHSLHGQAGASSETTAEQQNGPSSGLDRASRAGPGPGPPGCGLGRVRDSGGRAMPARGEKPGPGRCPRGDVAFLPDPEAAPRERVTFFLNFFLIYF